MRGDTITLDGSINHLTWWFLAVKTFDIIQKINWDIMLSPWCVLRCFSYQILGSSLSNSLQVISYENRTRINSWEGKGWKKLIELQDKEDKICWWSKSEALYSLCIISSSLFCGQFIAPLSSFSMGINALCSEKILIHCCRRAGIRAFYSAAISKRHETTILEATDGIIISVSGFINRSRTHENGFPPKVCMHAIVLESLLMGELFC